MKKQPKVSVILPIYNAEKYLHECLDSIVNQTLKDIEIICVNDGSKDKSLDIIKEYAARDKRVKYIDKPNGGYGHTMNRGIEAATGKYFGIVEPDDYIKPEMYEILYKKAEKFDLDIVKSNLSCFYGDENRIYSTIKYMKKEGYDLVDSPIVLQNYMIHSYFTTTGIYKTEFVKKNHICYNETPGAAYQDTSFWFFTHCLAEKICVLDQEFYCYRQDNPNQSVQNPRQVNALLYEYKTIYEFLKQHQLKKFIPLYFYRKFLGLRWYWRMQKGKARKQYLKIMKASFAEDSKNKTENFELFTPKEKTEYHNIIKYGEASVKIFACKLFGIFPMCGYKIIGGKKVYSLLGVPLLKIRRMANGFTTKYYFCGLPFLKITDK
ncbi:MAG: glycosyltransferase [Alphaproteobacteria bacterium]|nr:glycosyltransferase [Alphaproteobacteria bacterium]